MIGANSGGAVYPVDVATLNEAAVGQQAADALRARRQGRASSRTSPASSGRIGRIVAALFTAMADEDWTRLKLCGSQSCRWAFFDRSQEPLEPLVHDGLLRQPREGPALPRAGQKGR